MAHSTNQDKSLNTVEIPERNKIGGILPRYQESTCRNKITWDYNERDARNYTMKIRDHLLLLFSFLLIQPGRELVAFTFYLDKPHIKFPKHHASERSNLRALINTKIQRTESKILPLVFFLLEAKVS